MLNDLQIEAAARKLCEIRGLNPNGSALRMTNTGPSNQACAMDEIRAYLQVQEAVSYIEPLGALERIDPRQWAQMDEYFKSKWPSYNRAAEPELPPGPCECGHSRNSHFYAAGSSSCTAAGCPCVTYKG